MPTIDSLSQSQAAALLGVTARRLRQLHEEEDIPRLPNGTYDPKAFGTWLRIRSNPANLDARHEKALLDKTRREIAEVELAAKRNEVVPISEISAEWESLVATLRANLLSVPSRAAPEVVLLQDERAVENALVRTIHEALEVTASVSSKVQGE